MTQIQLRIYRGFHQPSIAAGHRIAATRIVTKIGFATNNGWTSFDSVAIIDTGAPLSLLPSSIWQGINRQVLGRVMAGGISEKPECRIPADLAIVECAISDGHATLGPYHIHALLAHNDKVPALLGLADALDHLHLSIDLSRNSAVLESP